MASAMAADWASLVAAAAAAVSAFATGFGVREAAKLRRLAITPVFLVDRTQPPQDQRLAEDGSVLEGRYPYRVRNVGQGAGLFKGIVAEGDQGGRLQTGGVLGRVLAPGEDVEVELRLGGGELPMPNPSHITVVYQSARGEIFASRISFDPKSGRVTELEAPHFEWRS